MVLGEIANILYPGFYNREYGVFEATFHPDGLRPQDVNEDNFRDLRFRLIGIYRHHCRLRKKYNQPRESFTQFMANGMDDFDNIYLEIDHAAPGAAVPNLREINALEYSLLRRNLRNRFLKEYKQFCKRNPTAGNGRHYSQFFVFINNQYPGIAMGNIHDHAFRQPDNSIWDTLNSNWTRGIVYTLAALTLIGSIYAKPICKKVNDVVAWWNKPPQKEQPVKPKDKITKQTLEDKVQTPDKSIPPEQVSQEEIEYAKQSPAIVKEKEKGKTERAKIESEEEKAKAKELTERERIKAEAGLEGRKLDIKEKLVNGFVDNVMGGNQTYPHGKTVLHDDTQADGCNVLGMQDGN